MHVTRLGLTPVKGMRHLPAPAVELTACGPLHDREFCLVDAQTGRVLRTVENDRLLACRAYWRPPLLSIDTPVGTAVGAVVEGEPVCGDYWGREAKVVTNPGPWERLLSRYLDRAVVLCRVTAPCTVVWAGPVSVVSTSSLAELARRIGRRRDEGARFRATVVVDTGSAPAFVEDSWAGRRLLLGGSAVTVRGPMTRCAVVDRQPDAGGHDANVLAALVPDRARAGEVHFGIDADVVEPGRVEVGDEARILDS